MYVTLKVIHFLALLLGGAGTIAPAAAARVMRRLGTSKPPPELAMTLRLIGIGSLIAIVLLWITGLGMFLSRFGGVDLGVAFIVKLIVATLIFIISVWLNLMAARAARTGTPPSPDLVRQLGLSARILLIVAVIAAVVTFNA